MAAVFGRGVRCRLLCSASELYGRGGRASTAECSRRGGSWTGRAAKCRNLPRLSSVCDTQPLPLVPSRASRCGARNARGIVQGVLLAERRMLRPGMYSCRLQLQCDEAITSLTRSVWQDSQAAVTSRGDSNRCCSAASFAWSTGETWRRGCCAAKALQGRNRGLARAKCHGKHRDGQSENVFPTRILGTAAPPPGVVGGAAIYPAGCRAARGSQVGRRDPNLPSHTS